jgi:hypothetical protein
VIASGGGVEISRMENPGQEAFPDTAAWLNSLQLGNLISLFEKQEIDLATVSELTNEDLRELGLLMGPRKNYCRPSTF